MTTPYYTDERVVLHHGDCLDVLAAMPDASVDAIVTDPPYGLGFMGKAWDDLPPGEPWARECLRALKPGGHLLAFGGTRTWHRLACAVEDAGFEMRDSIAWLYGSGFPKSLDVSKAIDKRANVNDETRRRVALVAEIIRTHREAKGMERAAVSLAVVGTPSGACWNWEHQQLPSAEMWPAIKRVLDIPDRFDGLIEGTRAQFIGAEREVIATGYRVRRESTVQIVGLSDGEYDLTAPATDAAREWAGWGTALKPAFEPIVVARKPLAGTVAANVLAWGTGALNIDGCRIEHAGAADLEVSLAKNPGRSDTVTSGVYGAARPQQSVNTAGRWPANVILDESQAAALDEQSGTSESRIGKPRGAASGDGWGMTATGAEYADSGGASRFFYTTKATSAERPFYWRLPCNCETIKPCAETSRQRDIGDSRSGEGKSWNMSTSGNATTVPSLVGTTSTTETATSSTTRPPTSSSSPSSNTSASIPAANCETASGGNPAQFVESSSQSTLSTGISAPKDGRFTGGAAPATSPALSGTSVCANCGASARRESHATVKPLDLMRWLVRLVTPPGGVVLDPFAGSGTTLEACVLEGFQCIAIEREADYLPLIVSRLDKPVQLGLDFGDPA